MHFPTCEKLDGTCPNVCIRGTKRCLEHSEPRPPRWSEVTQIVDTPPPVAYEPPEAVVPLTPADSTSPGWLARWAARAAGFGGIDVS